MFEKVDVCLFLKFEQPDGKSIRYFSGIDTDFGILLKFKQRQVLYLSELEEKPKPKKGLTVKPFDFEQVKKDLAKAKVKTIGLHYAEITKRQFDMLKKRLKGYKFVNIADEVTKIRQIKTPQEVKDLKKAIAITEDIIMAVSKKLKSFTYEIEAVQFIRQEFIKHNVVPSFPPIVASGTNSKNPHYHPKPTAKMQKGFCIIDMGVKYNGYCADITRTFYLGKPSQKEIDFYNNIKEQLYKFEKTIMPGDKDVKADFEMIHMIGHGIGLDVHESPGIGYEELREGICVAIEPARYTKSYGVRIEDDYHLTKKGLKRLSTTSRDLKII